LNEKFDTSQQFASKGFHDTSTEQIIKMTPQIVQDNDSSSGFDMEELSGGESSSEEEESNGMCGSHSNSTKTT
jgi:hypothetical protein